MATECKDYFVTEFIGSLHRNDLSLGVVSYFNFPATEKARHWDDGLQVPKDIKGLTVDFLCGVM